MLDQTVLTYNFLQNNDDITASVILPYGNWYVLQSFFLYWNSYFMWLYAQQHTKLTKMQPINVKGILVKLTYKRDIEEWRKQERGQTRQQNSKNEEYEERWARKKIEEKNRKRRAKKKNNKKSRMPTIIMLERKIRRKWYLDNLEGIKI